MQAARGIADIIAFNDAVLDQASALFDIHDRHPAVVFGETTGPHLRHVIEHYEALLAAAPGMAICYDARQRDAQLERHPHVARRRIGSLRETLAALAAAADTPLMMIMRCGVDGNCEVATRSSVGRELMFLACHAIHHYALIQKAVNAAGLSLPVGFGKAPATVHYEARERREAAA